MPSKRLYYVSTCGVVLAYGLNEESAEMYNTLEECRLAWEDVGKHGSIEDRTARNLKWLQYYHNIAEHQADGEAEYDPHVREVIDSIVNAGILHNDSTILDIGSGTGAYTLTLAKLCADVTALDMDDASLYLLAKRATASGLSNITCIQDMWENFNSNRKFSLTFSSMCPAICNYEELLKMEAMTTEACCLIAVTRGSYDLHRKNLMQIMNVKPKGGMTTEALWYYEILYLMGRQPDVRNWTRHFEYDTSIEEACWRNEVYFQNFDIPMEVSRPILREYFEVNAAYGLVHESSHLNMALIYWKVPH